MHACMHTYIFTHAPWICLLISVNACPHHILPAGIEHNGIEKKRGLWMLVICSDAYLSMFCASFLRWRSALRHHDSWPWFVPVLVQPRVGDAFLVVPILLLNEGNHCLLWASLGSAFVHAWRFKAATFRGVSSGLWDQASSSKPLRQSWLLFPERMRTKCTWVGSNLVGTSCALQMLLWL